MRYRFQLAATSPVLPSEQGQETTERTPVNSASLDLLRGMFLLLDEWDRAMQESAHSSGEDEITIDLKSS